MGSDSSAPVGIGGSIDVLGWLRTLPVAPEYHPTLAEFQDPIGYIFKIEKEASKYGICKIVPPVAPQSRKTTVSNLNRSLSARSPVGSPTFTTRQQQIGFCPRKHHPIQKPVWQSGEEYTVQEFEAKAKAFEKTYLRKCSKKNLNALEIETIYWKAIVDKPFSVEYANDMPGSAFAQRKPAAKHGGEGSVADTDWNMRGVSRARGSLLKFMKEEIPGVTSPMVYLAMMLSWFAWHVEDHDFHSLNYLHMGSGKTWYGVPRDAAAACEEVIRAHGYGGEINPLVTFSTLGEKTTVMSPEVLIDAGVPCCRLVQNAGEFVVTFPRAYHSGFSHGFNCGEAANIATPGWLTGAKEAAIRRASINQPPMVSHFQLLYDLALSSCSSVMKDTHLEPRSSRLKDKRRGEGEMLVKDLFVQDLLQNSNLLELLSKGSSVIILPENSPESGPSSKSGLQSYVERKKRDVKGRYSSLKQKVSPPCNDERPLYSSRGHEASMFSQFKNRETGEDRPSRADRSSEQGLFSCVTCGILCYACVAVIKPTNVAAGYLKTADCNQYKDWEIDNEALPIREQGKLVNLDSSPENVASDEPTDVNMGGLVSNAEVQNGASSLGLLALAYGNSSDTEEDEGEAEANDETNQPTAIDCSAESGLNGDDTCSIDEEAACTEIISAGEVPLQVTNNLKSATASSGHGSLEEDSCRFFSLMDSGSLTDISRHDMRSKDASSFSSVTHKVDKAITTASEQLGNIFSCATGPDEDSSRMHVFCLQHAIQVEKQLRTIGGAHVLLLCHPDYPEFEAQAKNMAEEFEDYNDWGHVSYRHASKDDEDVIQLALQSEEAVHGNGDWAVKLGINLFYSANLSRSPLYSKQMPYNSIIYKAFGRNAPTNDHTHGDRVPGRQRKVPVGGKWCGKVWMSNQIHPLLIQNVQLEEQKSTPSRVKPASKTVASRVKPAVKTDPSSVKPALRAPSSLVKPALRAPPSRVKPALRTPSSRVKPASRPVSKPERLSGRPVSKPERFSGKSRSVTAETVAGKKRKATAEIRPTVKAKSARAEVSDEESEDLPLKHTFKSCQRKRQITIQTPEARSVKNRIQLKDSGSGSGSDSGSDSGSESESEEEQEGPPSTRLRKRPEKPVKDQKVSKPAPKKPPQVVGKPKKSAAGSNSSKSKEETFEYVCDIEGCTSSFETKQELALHKRNTCPVKSCGKKFFSHKYLVQHRRVHNDDRPLKCPWKGCKMSFKWAWARTEHIRVHTGARPYVCSEAGCGQTFRFVSDFSRHKRKTGHCANKKSKG